MIIIPKCYNNPPLLLSKNPPFVYSNVKTFFSNPTAALAGDSTHTAVGLFRLLVRRSGTHCSQMNSEIRRVMSTASNSSLKQSCKTMRLAH